MRKAIGLAVALLWASTASSQTPPDTFKAGIGEYLSPFIVSTSVDSGKIAILLPESMSGRMITSIRAFYAPPNGGPVAPEIWMAEAAFTWGISKDSSGLPGAQSSGIEPVDLKSNPDIRIGAWVDSPVEWPVLEGYRYWLVGYWQRKATFIRLGRNQRDLSIPLTIGYASTGTQVWDTWPNEGFMVEVVYGEPQEGTPTGIFDPSAGETPTRARTMTASIRAEGLVVSLDASGESIPTNQPYNVHVVNTLGQTIVTQRGYADFSEIRIPWSANRPSGVYFCRILLGSTSHTVPVVNLK